MCGRRLEIISTPILMMSWQYLIKYYTEKPWSYHRVLPLEVKEKNGELDTLFTRALQVQ